LEYILEAFTLRRVIALPIFIAVVTAVVRGSAALSEYLTRQEGHAFLGVPSPAWGILAGLLLVFYFLIQYATRIRKSIIPKISVVFNPSGEGIVRTPTEVYQQTEGKWAKIRTDQAVYIRITIRAMSRMTVKGCVAFITRIQKRPTPTASFTEVLVFNAIALTQTPLDVYPRVPATVDFLKCGQFDNKLGFTVPTPFSLEGALDDNATYRFTIEVNGDGISETIEVEVDWTGKWDSIVAR
jgi:hypothetical protein